jgi:hypothetical protein
VWYNCAMNPIRHAALAVWSLVLLSHASACTPQPVRAPRAVWPAQLDYCVIGDSPEEAYEIGALVLEALDAWRVGATVETGTYHNPPQQIDCVPVLLVDGYAQGGRIGETAYGVRGPVWVTFARWWWSVCPAGRDAIVLHEIGHSVGYVGHGDDTSAMAVEVDCDGSGSSRLPTLDEISYAWHNRTRGIR